MKLGFIGFGEVGCEMSRGLKGAGLEGIVAYDVLQESPVHGGKRTRKGQNTPGLSCRSSPQKLIEAVDVLMVAVPGSAACASARAALSVSAARDCCMSI